MSYGSDSQKKTFAKISVIDLFGSSGYERS